MSNFGLSDAQVFAPGAIAYPSHEAIGSCDEWQEYLGELSIVSNNGTTYSPIPASYEKARSRDNPRPAWSGDHFWHLDLSREGSQVGNLVTAIYYAEGDSRSAGTDIIDTISLRKAMQEDGVFDREELSSDVLNRLQTEFSISTYYTETLANYARTASRSEIREITEFLTTRKIDGKTVSLKEYTEYLDSRYAPAQMPLLQANPFDTAGQNGLMFDVERGRDIIDPQTGVSYNGLLYAMRLYLKVKEPELRERDIINTIAPEPGTIALFSREGTLHRAQPGNDADRRVYLGWLATKQNGVGFES